MSSMFVIDLREMKQDVRDAISAFYGDDRDLYREAKVERLKDAAVALGEASGMESPEQYATKVLTLAHLSREKPSRPLAMVECINDLYPRLWLRILLLPITLSVRLAAWLVKAVR